MMPYNANEGLLSPGGADGFGRLLMRQGAVTGTPGDQNGGGGPMPLPGGDNGPGFGGGGPMPLPGGKTMLGGFDPIMPGPPQSYGPTDAPMDQPDWHSQTPMGLPPNDGRGFGGGGPMPFPPSNPGGPAQYGVWDQAALQQTNPQSIFGGPPKGNPIMPGPPNSYGNPEGGPTGFQPHPRGGALGDPTGGPQMGARSMGGGRGRDPIAPPQGGGNPYTTNPNRQSFNWGLPNKQQRF